ncbi:hypothetical protein ACFVV6_25615 [Bacillus mycoides]|uniref:hypothetical protein n=1 Tax=Bacillus mycoides TaxID=1405 RepID=UPI003669B55C
MSHLLLVRGLKYIEPTSSSEMIKVAPLVGTGIEMHSKAQLVGNVVVAPLVGAGIEILKT